MACQLSETGQSDPVGEIARGSRPMYLAQTFLEGRMAPLGGSGCKPSRADTV